MPGAILKTKSASSENKNVKIYTYNIFIQQLAWEFVQVQVEVEVRTSNVRDKNGTLEMWLTMKFFLTSAVNVQIPDRPNGYYSF